jgi:acetyl-CoA carboxylase biotin carboxyl carrier protein
MVGVFFTKAAPEAEPYVKIGSQVKKGDTLCVIEAMTLLNEITAERDGEIVGICATDGQMVEYAQVLFQMI